MYCRAAPDSTEIYTELGIMYLKINEVQRAQENLKEAIKIDDTSSKSLLALGAILQVGKCSIPLCVYEIYRKLNL